MSVFTVMISDRQHERLQHGPVPRALAALGTQRFGVKDAARYAVINYLATQVSAQPAVTEAGTKCLQVSLPTYLHVELEQRAALEHQSKAQLVRAAIDLFLPPARGEVSAAPTRPTGLNDARVRSQFADRTEPFATSGRY